MAGESFRVVAGNLAGGQIQLGDEFQIGRTAPGEGRLGDDPELSRVHAKVSRNAQGQIQVEDLGSTNGTAVNGRRITAPTVLQPGDTVQIGKTTLQFQDPSAGVQATALGTPAGAAAAPPPPPPPPAAGPPPPTAPLPGAPGAAPPFGGPPPPAPPAGGGPNRALLFGLGGLAAVAAIVIVLLLVLGGGDDEAGGKDEEDVRAALSSFLRSPDCDDLTDDGVQEFGGSTACGEALPEGVDEGDFEITKVSVSGDNADASVSSKEEVDGTYALERKGSDWQIADVPSGFVAAATPTTTETTPTETTPTETEEEMDPRETEAIATLQALIDAVQENDEEVFCGLLSPRQAQKLVGGAGGNAAIARCVEVARQVDLSKGVPSRIEVTGVRVTGNQASVRLTTGERFTLVRRGGRFVIDCCLG
jgi:hypothetical protein